MQNQDFENVWRFNKEIDNAMEQTTTGEVTYSDTGYSDTV